MIGKELGRYQIVEALGEGRMAAVYKGFTVRNISSPLRVTLTQLSNSQGWIFSEEINMSPLSVTKKRSGVPSIWLDGKGVLIPKSAAVN